MHEVTSKKAMHGTTGWRTGRDWTVTFRATITLAVMSFVLALAACLILIQIISFRAATREAASAFMDAASANALNRLEAQVSELAAVVTILSTNPFLADSDDRNEVDRRR